MIRIGFVALFSAYCAGSAAIADNLIKNGDFAVVAESGAVEGWTADKFEQKLVKDVENKPEGMAQSLCLDIGKVAKGHGQIYQGFRDLKKDTTYVLEGKLKSSVAGLAYFQIKLYSSDKSQGKNGEFSRTDAPKGKSTTEWQPVSYEFSTVKSDKVLIILRFLQDDTAIGQRVWFADVKLTEKAAPPAAEEKPVAEEKPAEAEKPAEKPAE